MMFREVIKIIKSDVRYYARLACIDHQADTEIELPKLMDEGIILNLYVKDQLRRKTEDKKKQDLEIELKT